MVKELAILANVIGSAYFMGGMLVQHDKAKELVAGMEIGFGRLLLVLKERETAGTIRFLLKFFGGITVEFYLIGAG